MFKIILVCLFSFVTFLSKAQQRLFIEKINNGKTRTIVLPAVVSIKLKSAGYKELLLERVSNDSFFFKKYYNQPENYDCSIYAISNLKFPKKQDVFVQTAFTFFTGTSLLLTMFTIGLATEKSTEASNPTQTLALVFGVPLSVVSILTSVSLAKNLPKNFSSKKWRIYVK